MGEGCTHSSVSTNASPQRANAPSPQTATSQQPSGAPPQRNRQTHNRPLSGIRASFCWAILTLWNQSSIPKLPCKTRSLTTHYRCWTTSNVPTRTREWSHITAAGDPPYWLLLGFGNGLRLLNVLQGLLSKKTPKAFNKLVWGTVSLKSLMSLFNKLNCCWLWNPSLTKLTRPSETRNMWNLNCIHWITNVQKSTPISQPDWGGS